MWSRICPFPATGAENVLLFLQTSDKEAFCVFPTSYLQEQLLSLCSLGNSGFGLAGGQLFAAQ